MSSEQKSSTETKEPPSAVLSGARKTTEPRMVRGTKSEKRAIFMLLRFSRNSLKSFRSFVISYNGKVQKVGCLILFTMTT